MSEIGGEEERCSCWQWREGGVWLTSTAARAAVGADGGGRRVVDVQAERAADKLL